MSAPGTGRLSNGSEGVAWMAAWCDTCVKDIDENCPLVLSAIIGEWPDEWRAGPHWSPQTVVSCDSYEREGSSVGHQ